MHRKHLIAHCRAHPRAEEDYPFGPDVAVYKIMGKIFALLPVTEPTSISLKCDPFWATVLRKTYAAVTPGYHLNKAHWNTIIIDGSIPDDEIFDMIAQSYALVVKGLSKIQRQAIEHVSIITE